MVERRSAALVEMRGDRADGMRIVPEGDVADGKLLDCRGLPGGGELGRAGGGGADGRLESPSPCMKPHPPATSGMSASSASAPIASACESPLASALASACASLIASSGAPASTSFSASASASAASPASSVASSPASGGGGATLSLNASICPLSGGGPSELESLLAPSPPPA